MHNMKNARHPYVPVFTLSHRQATACTGPFATDSVLLPTHGTTAVEICAGLAQTGRTALDRLSLAAHSALLPLISKNLCSER